MKLAHRLAYYLGGFAIGMVFLFFFLGGKRASCDYGPNARTLKNIRSKERSISPDALQRLKSLSLDTSALSRMLQYGDVQFSESNTKLDSCKQYVILGKEAGKSLKLRIENCQDTAFVQQIDVLD